MLGIRLNSIFVIVVSILFFFCLFGEEQKALIEIISAVDTSTITIGDKITYTISIDYSDSLQIEHPGAGVNLGQFEIKDYTIFDPEENDGRILQQYKYVISVFDTGRFTIPPFPVAYFPKDSIQNYKIIEASAITIYVKSILGEGEPELRDIKQPLSIPFDYILLISIIAIFLLLALGGFFGYRFYKLKKERGYLIKPPEPPRPAHEIALESLDLLKQKELPQKGFVKQYYTEISEIIRRYLENRYFIRALEETSFEILQDVEDQEIEREQIESLKEILELSDLVKFAKHVPLEEENDAILNLSYKFVEDTKIIFLTEEKQEADQGNGLVTEEESIEQSKSIN